MPTEAAMLLTLGSLSLVGLQLLFLTGRGSHSSTQAWLTHTGHRSGLQTRGLALKALTKLGPHLFMQMLSLNRGSF